MCVDDVRRLHGLPGGSLMKTLKYTTVQMCVKGREKTPIVNLHQKKNDNNWFSVRAETEE